MFLKLYCKFPITKSPIAKKRLYKVIRVRFQMYRNLPKHPTTNFAGSHLELFAKNPLRILQAAQLRSNMSEFSVHTFLFFLYQQQYFSTLYKTPVVLKNINALDVVPYSTLKYLINSVRHIKWKRYFIMHSNEIIEILFISLWLKNLKLFMDWMRKHFEKTNLKKHRKLFLLLNLLLGKFIWNYNIFLNLQGLRVALIGKFGKAGSVRKSRRYIRRGKCSYTTKKIALINQTNVIRTLTGVFSIKFEVFY